VISFLGSLGIKGSTQHFSYDIIWPRASAWGGAADAVFRVSFSNDQMNLIYQHAQARLLTAMNQTWGMSANISGSIAQTATLHADGTLFALFYLWIGTNIDASQPATLQTYMSALYPQVFVGAITDAGLDPDGVINVGNVSSPSTPVNSSVKTASAGYSSLLVVGALIGAGLLLAKKGRA
jgi:hypothetical protein